MFADFLIDTARFSPLKYAILAPTSNTWSTEIDKIFNLLKQANCQNLFPPHFLKASYGKIGGRVLTLTKGEEVVGVGLLFPRALRHDRPEFTLLFYKIKPSFTLDEAHLLAEIKKHPDLGHRNTPHIILCSPPHPQAFVKTEQWFTGMSIGQPDHAEALTITKLQGQIWGSDAASLYPYAMHAKTFRPGTSLVARVNEQVVGFLLGFYKFGGPKLPPAWPAMYQDRLRIESQLMGVLPSSRGRNIGFLLKKVQAQAAGQAGLDLIHWTFDPLQYTNAKLNLGKLRGLVFDFYPDYYDFRNNLNQGPASRLGVTWLINSARVQQALTGSGQSLVLDLSQERGIERVNHGWSRPRFGVRAQKIAFEVPPNWTALQKTDYQTALKWRTVTDQLLAHYLGGDRETLVSEGSYVITDVGEDGSRRYLVAERVSEAGLNLGQHEKNDFYRNP